jgi:hypothetical protein
MGGDAIIEMRHNRNVYMYYKLNQFQFQKKFLYLFGQLRKRGNKKFEATKMI